MRRILVVFLILLFPLNVLALSMSASSALAAGHAGAALLSGADAAVADAVDAFECDTGCDIDSDEPPAAPDLHDLVDQQPCLHLAGPGDGVSRPHGAAHYVHSPPPPVKPPRSA